MESIILNVIQSYLKDYVNNFRKEQISVDFLRGKGSLTGLDINVDAINDLVFGSGAPGLRFTRILCNTLAIRSPDVWSLKNKPIIFFVDQLFIEIAETVDIVKKPRPTSAAVAAAAAAKKANATKYGFINRVIDCLSFEVSRITIAFRTIGHVKTTAIGCWTPPVIVIELGGSRLFCTNHNGVETELNECIRVRNTRRPLLFMYKRLVVQRASIYIINPEVWFQVADELITGLSSGGILGLNRTLDKGSRGYVSCRIVHDVPVQMELCLRKRMDNNLLLGLEIAFIIDTVKVTIKEKYLSEIIHFFLGVYHCLFRLDVITEMFGPDPHGEGYTTSSAVTAPSALGSNQTNQNQKTTTTPIRGTIRSDQFGREERENLDRLDAEFTSTGMPAHCPTLSQN